MDTNNLRSRFEEQVLLHGRNATLGHVVKVYEHTDPNDNSNHEASVIIRDGEKEPRRIPILSNHTGEAIVPQQGDFVLIEFLEGKTDTPVITDVIQNDENRAPLARAGHWRHEFGPDRDQSLYIEAEPADHSDGNPEIIRIARKPDGLSDPSTSIELDDSGSTPVVRVQGECDVELDITGDSNLTIGGNVDLTVDGTVNLTGKGDVVIDQGGTAKRVATEDHTHNFTDADGNTGTTGGPDDTTSSKVE